MTWVAWGLWRAYNRLIRARTAMCNEMRRLLGEFDTVIALSVSQVRQAMPVLLENTDGKLNACFLQLLRELIEELREIDERVKIHDQRHNSTVKSDERIQRIMAIERFGPITVSALVAAVGDATNSQMDAI